MQDSAEKRVLIDEVDLLCTNYESIHTKCDGSRSLWYFFSVNVLQIWLAWMEILFFSKYFQKICQIHKPAHVKKKIAVN